MNTNIETTIQQRIEKVRQETILGNSLMASNTKPNDGYNPELVFM